MNNISLKEIPIDEAVFSVLDFETTGTSARHSRVIEVGVVRVKNLKITDTYQTLINPGTLIPPFITSLTGIGNNDVINAPYFDEIANNLLEFFSDSIITAHNLPFDKSFLKHELARAELQFPNNLTLCTLKLARQMFPQLKSKSLGNLTKHFRIQHKNVHRALGDSMVTAKLLIKMIKQLKDEHHVEKVSELIGFQLLPQTKPAYRVMKKKLSADFAALPSSPGVYLFKNAKDDIVYIGKAKVLKQRVSNYFSSSAAKKAKQIVRKSSRLEFIRTNTELSALIAETELIKKHNPPLNTLLKKYPQQYFIKIKQTHDYPDLSSKSKFDFDGDDYFGPYTNRDSVKALIEITDRAFQLRECTDKELKKNKKCYLADIKRCLAPCVNNDISSKYNYELKDVYKFLSGSNQFVVDRLLNKMKVLSEQKKYEEAGKIRDTVNLIINQINRSTILAEPVNKVNALIKIKSETTDDYILFLEGAVFIRNLINNRTEMFDTAISDYFEGNLDLYKKSEAKDLERMKIALGWMVKNRNMIKIYYLKQFNSRDQLFAKIFNN